MEHNHGPSTKKSMWTLSTFLGLLLSAHVTADTVTRDLDAEYAKAAVATKKKDIVAVMARYAPDFKMKAITGKILTRDMVQDLLARQYAATKTVREASTHIDSLDRKGDTVITTVHEVETLVVVLDQHEHVLSAKQVSVDTWQKTTRGWKLKYQEIKKSNTFRDGKPME